VLDLANHFSLLQINDSLIKTDQLVLNKSEFPLHQLPFDLIYPILKQLAKECQNKQEFFQSAKSLVHVWSQRYKYNETPCKELEKNFFENIHSIMNRCLSLALNQGLLTINELKLDSLDKLFCFLNENGSPLKTLDLNQFKFPIKEQDLLKIVSLCQRLKNIDFGRFTTTDDVLIALSKLKKLENVSLLLSQQVTKQGICALTHLKLKKLAIYGGDQLQDQDVEFLAKIPTLRNLSLNHCTHLTDDALMFFKDCSLTSLSLKGNSFTSEGMGKFFRELKKNYEIVHLNLSCTNCDQKTLASLSACSTLKTLELNDCKKLQDQGFEHLKELPLEKLFISGCSNMTDEALSCIGNMKQLQNLALSHCTNITDEGIKKLSIPGLRTVDLSCCHQLTSKTITVFDREGIELLKLTSCHRIKLQKLKLNHLKVIDSKYLTFGSLI
jgi:hypothetical protein